MPLRSAFAFLLLVLMRNELSKMLELSSVFYCFFISHYLSLFKCLYMSLSNYVIDASLYIYISIYLAVIIPFVKYT